MADNRLPSAQILDSGGFGDPQAQGKSGEFDDLIHAVRKGHEDHQVIRTRNRPDTTSAGEARL